jgi:mannose-6-phosphate isomerase-like protein (cupin superfamily)
MNEAVKKNPHAKGSAIVLGPEDGLSYWQPKPSTGYIMGHITPYNSPYDNFSAGIQVLEPGAAVREHGHERSHELLFVYEGSGFALIDGERHELEAGSTIMVGRRVMHYVENTGDTQMKIHWVIFPAGLEDWFAAIGRPRKPGETEAPVFDRPDGVEHIQDRLRFVRPGE